jgi:hypothetical protein
MDDAEQCELEGHRWLYISDSTGEGLFRTDCSFRRCERCDLEEPSLAPRERNRALEIDD